MISKNDIERVQRATAYDSNGAKVGSVDQVYLDDASGEPTWAAVNTGFFGTKVSFVPLQDASFDGDDLRVAYTKDEIKDAPNIDLDHHLDAGEEQALYRHYGLSYDAGYDTSGVGYGRTDVGYDRDTVADRDVVETTAADRGRSVEDTGVVLHEEQVRAGTETREAGRVRLRKYVTTETQTVEVPVSKEKLVIERTPASGDRATGPITGTEQVEEITLREERPVVDKETVAVEEVRVGKETVTDTERISTEVQKEQVELDVEGDVTQRGDLL